MIYLIYFTNLRYMRCPENEIVFSQTGQVRNGCEKYLLRFWFCQLLLASFVLPHGSECDTCFKPFWAEKCRRTQFILRVLHVSRTQFHIGDFIKSCICRANKGRMRKFYSIKGGGYWQYKVDTDSETNHKNLFRDIAFIVSHFQRSRRRQSHCIKVNRQRYHRYKSTVLLGKSLSYGLTNTNKI